MGLFMCSRCGVVENTATGNYWSRYQEPLCSQCDRGQWHGLFPRQTPEEAGLEIEVEGMWRLRRKEQEGET